MRHRKHHHVLRLFGGAVVYLRHVHTWVQGGVATSVVAPVVGDVQLAVGGQGPPAVHPPPLCRTGGGPGGQWSHPCLYRTSYSPLCHCLWRLSGQTVLCGLVIVIIIVGTLSYGGGVVVAPIPVVRSHLMLHGGRDGLYDLCHGVPPYVLSAALYRAQNCCDRIPKYRRVRIDRGVCDNGDTLTAARDAIFPGQLWDQTSKYFCELHLHLHLLGTGSQSLILCCHCTFGKGPRP